MKITFFSPTLAKVTSYSKTMEEYDVNLEKNTCTCRNFIIEHARNQDHVCKHIRDAKEYLNGNIE